MISQIMETIALAPTRNRGEGTRIAHSGTWTVEEDEMLTKLVSTTHPVSWSLLAAYFPNKTAPQLAGRWEKVINPQLVKGSWTREEDETIIAYVKEHGNKDWAKLALLLKGRTGKQCRERFKNHLDATVNHSAWTNEEDNLLIDLHNKFGNAWTTIASYFDGRTDNSIKNRWNSTIKKRLERMQNGEPLVRKRGRKRKGIVSMTTTILISDAPKPQLNIPSESSPIESPNSCCSSPIPFSRMNRPRYPLIDLVPLHSHFPFKPISMEGKTQSLQQNRLDLQRMLNELIA